METFPSEESCIRILYSLLKLQNENWEGKPLQISKFTPLRGQYPFLSPPSQGPAPKYLSKISVSFQEDLPS